MEQHDEIHGTTGNDAHKVAIGKGVQQVSVYSDANTFHWREFVRRDLEKLEQRTVLLLIMVFFLFIFGAIATGLTIRQFDLSALRTDRQIERLERMIPTPTPWVWPGEMP